MKKTITSIIITFFATTLAIAQTDNCRCNELFDKDLKNQYTSFSSQNSKEILYKYFTSDQTTRQSMKNDASIEGSVGLVIKAVPIDIGFGSSSSSSNDRFYSMYKQSIENKYISDEILQSLYSTALPDKSFTAYENCLKFCDGVYNNAGVILRNISTQDDLVVLELKFKSTPSGGKISIKDATYSTGTVIGGKKFEKDVEIVDGQVLYEHIKIRPEDNITVTIAFNGGVSAASLALQSKNKMRKSSDEPLGTIVASLLNYDDFLKLNGMEYESDINKVVWVPCDGRDIGTLEGTYGAYSGGKSPDLRGLFLRSVNDMGAYNATVPTPVQGNLNPDNFKAGKVQMDAFQSHSHKFEGKVAVLPNPNYSPDYLVATGLGGYSAVNKNTTYNDYIGVPIKDGSSDNPRLSSETRPKNISVYYYVKIR